MMKEGRKAVDRLRRVYVPGGPLYAQRPFKYQGKQFFARDPLPVETMSKARHRSLWTAGFASHVPSGPFDKRKEKPSKAAPVKPIEMVSPPKRPRPRAASAQE